MKRFQAAELAQQLGGELTGPGDVWVDGIESPEQAEPSHICYVGEQSLVPNWDASKSRVALIDRKLTVDDEPDRAIIRVSDGEQAFIRLLELFAPPAPAIPEGISARASVHPDAKLGADVVVGELSLIGAATVVGLGTVIHPRVTIFSDVRIGANCVIYPGVVIRERCEIGDHCILHPNVVIGADGFGFRPRPDGRGLMKVPQIGSVRVGSHVEIGAGTCIDRGTFSRTEIGDGTKIDNLCQIGHNCRIGRSVVMAGQVGMAGSVTVGDGTMIGGQVGVKDHLKIGSGVKLAACSAVMNDIPDGAVWGGYPARDWRETVQSHLFIRKLYEQQVRERRDRRTDGPLPSGSPEAGSA
ncbi:MAG: UDP-3-O-(3-hydroxymyristoyl)glucosamine N-acyltransferase [Phycisphaeraceae bacterium]|nr:UDP-3-O-(3-hydroxymyristoyl)glucosamine N-acyltransferase [Phycisphaeraceae bacterium]